MLSRRAFAKGLAALPLGAVAPRALFAATPSIVATTGMVADAAAYISGSEVKALMGPGIDPHSHRATRNDILSLTRADVVFWHGLHLEAQLVDLMADLARSKPVVAIAESVPKETLLGWPQYPDRPDPHIWFDPDLWAKATMAIESTLADLGMDTSGRAAEYRAEIARVGDYARAVLGSVPEQSRILVTAHDAFSYFGRAFGFEVEGVQGISTESEAGLQRIGQLVDLLVDRNVPAVFVESSVSDRTIRALVEGAAARGHSVVIGGELFSDAMGPAGTYEGTWAGMMDHNATVIARALGGQAPERGESGKLGLAG